ncbi:nitroreductase [Alkalispirochaeta sphaeroplastigenens]|uniref:Nitroreductase n=1 Tax=Alkalispirochaeta sphaeroplastigenens TaxID=1187066 RepID=A0A2S4JNV0_9SPIO|nr:nitroreductase family protein [Alkalispirochaeta sphaeroplastigenens]POR01153.1 nitroreductase [Alkalispirochaeta sphaeroplastigenens]
MAEIVPEIMNRRARRAYGPRGLDQPLLERVLEAAVLAPSCNNKQPWRFLVCQDETSLGIVRGALPEGNYWAREAPVLLVVTTRDDLDCRLNDNREYALFDTGLAVMNLMLQATKEGLYAHPMAGFDPLAVRQGFGIEDETRIITVVALGFPGDGTSLNEKHRAAEHAPRERKPLAEVVQWNRWQALA